MPKKKNDTKQNQQFTNTATYGWQAPPDTADTEAYRNYRPEVDPTISFAAGNARNRLNSSFVNPLGGQMTAQMQDRLRASGNRQIDQDASQAFRAGQYDVNEQRGGQLAGLAALTAPRMVQTGSSGNSSGTSNTTQGNNLFGDVMQVGQAGAGIAAML